MLIDIGPGKNNSVPDAVLHKYLKKSKKIKKVGRNFRQVVTSIGVIAITITSIVSIKRIVNVFSSIANEVAESGKRLSEKAFKMIIEGIRT